MKDKDIYDLIENIEELDKLSFDYEQWEEFNLSDEEKMLVENRYFKDLTQSEVAKIMDVNQVYVSRMEKKVLKKMKMIF